MINTDLYNAILNDCVNNTIRIVMSTSIIPIVATILAIGYYSVNDVSGLQLINANFGIPVHDDSIFTFILLEKS